MLSVFLSAGNAGTRSLNLPLEPEQARSVQLPQVACSAAILMEGATGQVLYEHNPDARLANASTTKIITAIVVAERCDLQEKVTVSEAACSVGESSIWLEPGETLTVEQLLYALLIQSANDAATALAEHVGGSVQGFADLMNARAAELGCTNSHFMNPHGLDDPNHYTSARDLAILGRHAMTIPIIRKVVPTQSYVIPWAGHPWDRVAESHNRFYKRYAYATGIKTGLTDNAGYCLVGAAMKDGRELISVVLNSPAIYDETIALMEHGFNDFVRPRFSGLDGPLTVEVGDYPRMQLRVSDPDQPELMVRRDRLGGIKEGRLMVQTWLPYPIKDGDEVGQVVLEGAGNPIVMPLRVEGQAPEPGFFQRVKGVFETFWNNVTGIFS
jgi:D-alanyl-D-alanine carboxypeptidase (penicillin-binding protein 5/6)